jgi:hypothetical protein
MITDICLGIAVVALAYSNYMTDRQLVRLAVWVDANSETIKSLSNIILSEHKREKEK